MSPTPHDARRAWAPRTTRRGAVDRWTRTLIPTLREAPADADTPSHRLLLRAGFVRQVTAGVYDYLPLAWRVLNKICEIVREEMHGAGACELFLPVIVPIELYAGTKRDQDYGPLLFTLSDRKQNTIALAPTHEETITELLRTSVNSYKQLPLSLYQIQTKFRDEARPRAGLLRCREFIMKDAYSFHVSVDGPGGLDDAYDAMYRAYSNIFTRCGLDYTAVEAESGPIGGSASHEFMVNCESGEDTILRCPVSGYAANVEKCEIGPREWSFGAPEPSTPPAQPVHTPGLPGIDQVAAFLKTTPDRMLKTLVFQPAEGVESGGVRWVLGVLRGDHDANEGKVRDAVGFKIVLADDKAARAAGFAIGYVSPRALLDASDSPRADTRLVIDPDAARPGPIWATGADRPDHHVTAFSWRRELGSTLDDPRYVKVADIRNALAGDPSSRAPGSMLVTQRGIEVGHVFKLGTKYSEAMGFNILDASQKKHAVIMGCYGIGVSRTLAACAEMSHDENGLRWPAAIAPYHCIVTLMKPEDPNHAAACTKIVDALAGAGLDVIIDDRDERPGVKFKDADLIGIPLRITIGDKSLAEGAIELKHRSDPGKGSLVPLADAVPRCLGLLAG